MKRYDIINLLIEKYDLKSYLEIGVFKGDCFNRIRCELKDSVDPNFEAIYEMTSDEFFEGYASIYDVIFIDGMHTAKQTYKDIVNSLQRLIPGGFILVHDCNPATKWHTRPPEEYKRGEEWNGTTYQGFLRFKEEHPELTCFTIDTDYGVGLITNKPMLKNEIFNTWDYFDKHRKELLQLVGVDEFRNLV